MTFQWLDKEYFCSEREGDLIRSFEVTQQEQLDKGSSKEGNKNMEKNRFATVATNDLTGYLTEDDAVVVAKRYTSKYQKPYYVLQAIAKIESPVPEAIVTKL